MSRYEIADEKGMGGTILWRVWEVDHTGHRWRGSRPHKAREDAEAELARIIGMPACVECGDTVGLAEEWRSDAAEIIAAGMCSTCFFWHQLLAADDGIVIRGRHYKDGGRRRGAPSHCLGFGGTEYRIRMHDGREISSNNLWTQGDIPEHFRDRLQDNAEFLSRGPQGER
jgi:hypothetical protein